MKRNRSAVAGVALLVVVAGALVVTLLASRLLAGPSHQLRIDFPSADGLVAGSDVLEAGAKVGTILAIEPTTHNSAVVTVSLAGTAWPLHQGLRADIRPKSLLGEKYVDVHDGPAAAPAYDAATVLTASEKAVPVELDQFLNSLDPPTRVAARILLNDAGAGVAGRGADLNQAIATGKQNLANLAVFGTTLDNRDPDLDRILVGLDGVLGKLTQTDQLTQLSQLITNGQKTLDSIEQQQVSFSRQFSDAQTALAELNVAVDTAVPSLRSALRVAPDLLSTTTSEANVLAFLAGVNADPVLLQALDQGLIHGPTVTGGALESTQDASGRPVTRPIFRICLTTPQPSSSCMGQGFNGGGATPVPSAFAGGSDLFLLAGWLRS